MSNIQALEKLPFKVEGFVSAYNLTTKLFDSIQREAEQRQIDPLFVHKPWILERLQKEKIPPVYKVKNQILKDGLQIYLNRGPQSVSRISAGTEPSPTASTYTTQQSIQQPLSNLLFTRVGAWEVLELANGFQFSFTFRRPLSSSPGVTITEMALRVVEGVNEANLSRIVAPSAGLPHTFSNTDDTLAIWDLRVTV